jgi:hypothetical protein
MGSLIFLLLITTQMISTRASTSALAENSSPQLPLLSVNSSLQQPEEVVAIPLIEEEPSSDETTEPTIDVRAVARQQRMQELESLEAEWQMRLNELKADREDRARLLLQRQQLQKAAADRLATMQAELKDLELKVGKMTGELSAYAAGNGTAKERIELETQIRELKQRLRAAAEAPSTDEKFEVVPFDVLTGTSRRPIMIECTSTGLRFIPEDILVTPADLAGFSPHVNPLIIGSSALVNYWTAWNIRQPNPGRQPEPYVLLLVRPNGTIAYYVAMKMLSEMKQPHGYELIEEDTVLQLPKVDAGAKAACETAIQRLLAERNKLLRQPGNGLLGNGTGSGSGSGRGRAEGLPGGQGQGAGRAGAAAGGSGDAQAFELADIMSRPDTSNQSWERVENFEGAKRNSGGPRSGSPQAATERAGAGFGGQAAPTVTTSKVTDQATAAKPGTATTVARPVLPEGVESLEDADETDEEGPVGNSSAPPPIGLGSSGNRPIPVEDRRTQKKKSNEREVPMEPEHLAGKHWGLSGPGASIGLEREVRINVEPKRYVVGKKHLVNVLDTDSREDTFVKIITVLELQAHDWGEPPQGFFWKPGLRYIVAEGADANYDRIHSMLERAGLSGTREFASDHAASKDASAVARPTAASPASTPAAPKPSRRILRGILK